jgi:hypothetical protein
LILSANLSFGFSVGDFVAIRKLVADITSALQSTSGAKSEYQELIREFQALEAALRHLDRLEAGETNSESVKSIKCAALHCRQPLADFFSKIKKYDKSLGICSRSNVGKTAADKLRWTFGEKEDIRRLQTYLNIHVGTINMQLAEHGLERMAMLDKNAKAEASHARAQLGSAHSILDAIKKDLPGQALRLTSVHTMVSGLCKLVCGEMLASVRRLGQAVNNVW